MTAPDHAAGHPTTPGWRPATAPPQSHAAYQASVAKAAALLDRLDALAATGALAALPQPDVAAAHAYLRSLLRAFPAEAQLSTPVGSAARRRMQTRLLAVFWDGSFVTCPHVGSRPTLVALLAERLLLCQDCLQTMTEPPPLVVPEDQCDLCGRRSVAQFWPVAIQLGAIVMVGDACNACFAALTGAGGAMPKGWG